MACVTFQSCLYKLGPNDWTLLSNDRFPLLHFELPSRCVKAGGTYAGKVGSSSVLLKRPACSHSQSVNSTSGDMPCMRRVSPFRLIQCRSQLYQFRCLHYCLEEVTGCVRQQVLLACLPDANSLSFRLVVRMSQGFSRSQAVDTYDFRASCFGFDVIASV